MVFQVDDALILYNLKGSLLLPIFLQTLILLFLQANNNGGKYFSLEFGLQVQSNTINMSVSGQIDIQTDKISQSKDKTCGVTDLGIY